MQPVWVRFGAAPSGAAEGVVVLALLANARPVWVCGQSSLAVLVPTAPIPVGGGLLFVPEHWVTPAALGAEALTSLYVSMGVTAPEHLPAPPGREGPQAGLSASAP